MIILDCINPFKADARSHARKPEGQILKILGLHSCGCAHWTDATKSPANSTSDFFHSTSDFNTRVSAQFFGDSAGNVADNPEPEFGAVAEHGKDIANKMKAGILVLHRRHITYEGDHIAITRCEREAPQVYALGDHLNLV